MASKRCVWRHTGVRQMLGKAGVRPLRRSLLSATHVGTEERHARDRLWASLAAVDRIGHIPCLANREGPGRPQSQADRCIQERQTSPTNLLVAEDRQVLLVLVERPAGRRAKISGSSLGIRARASGAPSSIARSAHLSPRRKITRSTKPGKPAGEAGTFQNCGH